MEIFCYCECFIWLCLINITEGELKTGGDNGGIDLFIGFMSEK